MHPAITYALLALCGSLFVASIAVDYVREPVAVGLRRYSALMTVVSLAGAYAVLAPGFGVDGREAVRTSVDAGRPLFMEFFSNTCAPCLMAKPAVDGLERQLGDRAGVARVNIFSESGEELAARYRVNATPTYLLLDASGKVIHRQVGGMPNAEAILDWVEKGR
jgi:thioredoxin 1